MKRSKESENKALYQQLMDLEKDWASFKRSNKSLNFPQISANSDSSSTTTTTTLDFFKLVEKSPRSLMSSLQNSKSPIKQEGVNWKVKKKKNDLAVEEIIRDRRTALASGKLKGRRLFGEITDEKSSSITSTTTTTTNSQEVISEDEICSHCLVLLKGNMNDSKNNENVTDDYSSTSSFSTKKKALKDREIRMIEGDDHRAVPVNLLERKCWRYRTYLWLLLMAIFVFTVSAFTQGVCLIAGKQVEEVIPLPT